MEFSPMLPWVEKLEEEQFSVAVKFVNSVRRSDG